MGPVSCDFFQAVLLCPGSLQGHNSDQDKAAAFVDTDIHLSSHQHPEDDTAQLDKKGRAVALLRTTPSFFLPFYPKDMKS